MKWTVQIPEVHISTREIEAETEDKAIEMALEDLDTEVSHEYSHTVPWDIKVYQTWEA